MERHQPLVQRNMAILEDRSNGHAELLPAGPTVKQTAPRMGFRTFLEGQANGITDHAAVRAKRAIRPAFRFQIFTRFVVILKVGLK
jgi:hypothetical protein